MSGDLSPASGHPASGAALPAPVRPATSHPHIEGMRKVRPLVPWTLGLAVLFLVGQGIGLFAQAGDPVVMGTLQFLFYPVAIGLVVVGGLFFVYSGVNVSLMGARDRKWGDHWGMLAWVIPAANVLLPWFYVREVWQASDPKAGPDDWQEAALPTWMVLWWGAWGGAQLFGLIGSVMGTAVGLKAGFDAAMQGTGPVADLTIPTWLRVVQWTAVALMVIALPFFVKLVLALTERQEARAQRLALLAERPATPGPTRTF